MDNKQFLFMKQVRPSCDTTMYYKYTLPKEVLDKIKAEAFDRFGIEPNEVKDYVEVIYKKVVVEDYTNY